MRPKLDVASDHASDHASGCADGDATRAAASEPGVIVAPPIKLSDGDDASLEEFCPSCRALCRIYSAC